MRVLVLYVDRDGDLKTQNFTTPVVGRDDVLRLGIKYILNNPDDSDANAIFAAVKIYDKLVGEYGAENVNVAVVSGSPDPATADVTVVKELEQVLSYFDADASSFVSDGPSDEAAIPAIQLKRPVISVSRVVVKQARGVEETVTLFRYYFNKAVREPEYRRYTVGVPALFLFIVLLGATFSIEAVRYFLNLVFLFIAFFLMAYGFGVYDFLKNTLRKFEVTFIITMLSLFVIVIHIISIALNTILMPEYLVTIAAVMPYASYITEAYVKNKSVKYGGILAGAVTFAFFYLLYPKLLSPQRDFIEVFFAFAQFLTVVLMSTILVYVVRAMRRRVVQS